MARITAEALDDGELRRYRDRGRPRTPNIRLPARPDVRGPAAMVLVAVGSGILLASVGELELRLVAIAAVAVGGWLAHTPPAPANEVDRTVLFRERQEVIRAAVVLGLRSHDGGARRPDERGGGAPEPQLRPDDGDDRELVRPVHIGSGYDDGRESLEPDADAAAYGG